MKYGRFLQECPVEIEFEEIRVKIDRTEWNETNETKWK